MGDLLRRRILNSTGGKSNPFQNAPSETATNIALWATPVYNATTNRYISRTNSTYFATSDNGLFGTYTQRSVTRANSENNIGTNGQLISLASIASTSAYPTIYIYEPNNTGTGTTITAYSTRGKTRRANVTSYYVKAVGNYLVESVVWSFPYIFVYPNTSGATTMVEYVAHDAVSTASLYTVSIGEPIYDAVHDQVIQVLSTARSSGNGSGGIAVCTVTNAGAFTKHSVTTLSGAGVASHASSDFLCIINGVYYLLVRNPDIQSSGLTPYWMKSSDLSTWSNVSNGENIPVTLSNQWKFHQFSDGLVVIWTNNNNIVNNAIYSSWDLVHWDYIAFTLTDRYCSSYGAGVSAAQQLQPNWQEDNNYYYFLTRNTAGAGPTASHIIAWPKA